jgi:hypothetical protein
MSKLIRIISGTYGHREGTSPIVSKTSADEPFEIDDFKADRLVLKKVAEIVEADTDAESTDAGDGEGGEDNRFDAWQKKDIIAALEELGAEYNPKANKTDLYETLLAAEADAGSEKTTEPTDAELVAWLDELGVSFDEDATREELIALYEEALKDAGDGEGGPDVGTADVVQ